MPKYRKGHTSDHFGDRDLECRNTSSQKRRNVEMRKRRNAETLKAEMPKCETLKSKCENTEMKR
jgi:hypothetical protein